MKKSAEKCRFLLNKGGESVNEKFKKKAELSQIILKTI